MVRLNEFTGVSTQTLKRRLKREEAALASLIADEDAGGGGSPLESIHERIDDLVVELRMRGEKALGCSAHHPDPSPFCDSCR